MRGYDSITCLSYIRLPLLPLENRTPYQEYRSSSPSWNLHVLSSSSNTDQNNLTHKYTECDCEYLIYHILIIKEYGVELKYIKGKDNDINDALSRLEYNYVELQ